MKRHILLFLLFSAAVSILEAQYVIKKKVPAVNDSSKNSAKGKSDFPKLHFNSLDSLKEKSLKIQNSIEYSIPMYKPAPNMKYNMPMVSPAPDVKYYMPMYKGPKDLPQEDGATTTAPKNLLKEKIPKAAPKKQNKK